MNVTKTFREWEDILELLELKSDEALIDWIDNAIGRERHDPDDDITIFLNATERGRIAEVTDR